MDADGGKPRIGSRSAFIGGAAAVKRVELLAVDPWRRVLTRQSADMASAGPAAGVSFRVPTGAAQHRAMELTVRILDDAGCIQERRLLGVIMARPDRWHAFRWTCYSPDSDIRPEITGYDSRYRSFISLNDIVMHLWCNMNMTGLTGGLPMATDILMPGDAQKKPPAALPEAGALTDAGGGEMPALEEAAADLRRGYIRVPCLMDPAWRKGQIDGMESYFRTRAPLARPFHCSMGDEFFYTKELVNDKEAAGFRRQFILSRDGNICRCEHCLKAFREYVRQSYAGNLSAVNAEWSTAYTSWDEVEPPLLSSNRVKVAKTFQYVDLSTSVSRYPEHCPPEERWAHILDHRAFIDWQVAGIIRELREACRRGAPESKLGWGDLMGDTSMWNGLDAFLLAPIMDYNALDHEINIWQTLGHPDNSHFVGYSKQYSAIREAVTPWEMMFDGNTGIGNWNSPEYPKHREDFTFHDASLVTFANMREIREQGFDRLIVGRRFNDPVAVHYDPRSIYAAEMQEWQEDPASFFGKMAIGSRGHVDTCKKVENTYIGLLEERSLQYYTTAYGQLEQGHFGPHGTPRLLFLPYTQCLSSNQAATLERFVREGGVLVGDVHTGFRDGHGRRRAEGCLNRVFGIRQTRTDGMRVRHDASGQPVAVRFGPECGGPYSLSFDAVEPGDIEPTTAKAWARFALAGKEQPAFLVNSYGKGKAIYLNFLPTGFREVVGDVTEGGEGAPDGKEGADSQDFFGAASGVRTVEGKPRDWFKAMFAAILNAAGISDPVRCTPGGARVSRFGAAAAMYIGIEAGYKEPEAWKRPYELVLPDKRHVYDMRDGQYLGLTDRISARFDTDKLKMALAYAALTYKVEGLEVKMASNEIARGGSTTFEVRIQPAEAHKQLHAIGMRLLDPRGRDLYWYRNCLQTRDGLATGRIDLAENDEPGEWILRLRDAATGTTVDRKFMVR